jgi:hypothetical protein
MNKLRKISEGTMSSKETIWARALLEYLTLVLIFLSACYILIGHVLIWYKLHSKFNGTFGLALGIFPLTALLVGKFFKDFNRGLLPLIAVCFIFALPLCGLFQTGASDGASIIGGLIPYSDAHGYYVSALRLNQGSSFDSFGARRPLFHGFLTTIYALSGNDLRLALMILTLIGAIAVFVSGQEIQRQTGIVVAFLFIMVMFCFYRRFIGTTLSENLGLPFGLLAFYFLVQGTCSREETKVHFGMFLLSLGLNARAGTFFVLPLLMLWGGWFFRKNKVFSPRFFLYAGIAVCAGFASSKFLLSVIGGPQGQPLFSNFSYTFYGLIHGGNWTLAMKQLNLGGVSEMEASKKILAASFETLRQDPFALMRGMGRAWNIFLFHDYVFSFTEYRQLNYCLQIFSVFGLTRLIKIREPLNGLMVCFVVGIFLSVPFLPPWDADGMRAYATSIPFIALLPSLGLSQFWVILQRLIPKISLPGSRASASECTSTGSSLQAQKCHWIFHPTAIFTILMIVASILAPMAIQRIAPISSSAPKTPMCPDGSAAVPVRYLEGSFLNLIEDKVAYTSMPDVRVGDFRRFLDSFLRFYPENKALLASIPANFSLGVVNGYGYIAAPTTILKNNEKVYLCGHRVAAPYLSLLMLDSPAQ